MSTSPTYEAEHWATTVFRISRDRRARRELLWLLAMAKGDLETAADVERADPGVVERILAAGLALPLESPPAASRAWHAAHFGPLTDAWFELARVRFGGSLPCLPPVV